MKPNDSPAAHEILEKLLADAGNWSDVDNTHLSYLSSVVAWLETVSRRLLADSDLTPTVVQMSQTHHLVPLCTGRESGYPEEPDFLVVLKSGRWRYWFTDCLMAIELPVCDRAAGDPDRITIIWSTRLHRLWVVAWSDIRSHVRLTSSVPPSALHPLEPSVTLTLHRLC